MDTVHDTANLPRLEAGGAVYDEMVTGTGRVRPHWQALIGRLAPLEQAALEERRDEAVQLLRQHGATYAIYGDPRGADRPWPLDFIPFLISDAEWKTIEAAAVQRISLLNAILADLYGSQLSVASGRIPPALVHANPAFLRPCHGLNVPGGVHLHFTAIDLARAPDGEWRVLADRTQAPSGAGYALENRSVVGRVLADCIADGLARPLAPFFTAFRDNLNALMPAALEGGGRQPRIVLLTPGPYNETYFEHVYLARQFGITLVEGNDLTVRNRQVFLRTLSGLEPVGVILRRLDDDFCDPLELRSSSALGVAGLAEAIRAGTVAIANALGSGAMEAAAFKPLIADLARTMTGAELIFRDVATWWCGRPADCAYVLDHLETLVIKPAFPGSGAEPVFGGELSRSARQALAETIVADPIKFVGQEHIPLSTTPVWDGGGLEPRPLVLRVFVAATSDGFAVMPGGLTRTAPGQKPVVSMQQGGSSKDTWVICPPADVETRTPQRPNLNVVSMPQTALRRSNPGDLPSRVADNLFWVGRYAERVDGMARLLRTLLGRVTDASQPWRYLDAQPILNVAAWLELTPLVDQAHAFQPVALVQAALLDARHPAGVIANLQRLLHAARAVRDRLPSDCWRIITALERHSAEVAGSFAPVRLLLRLEELVTLGAALSGAINETMPRDAGWHFVEIGRRLERALHLVTIVRGLQAPPKSDQAISKPIEERRLLAAILALTDSRATADLDTAQWDGMVDRATVLRSVLANNGDPRSLTYQLLALAEHLSALPRPSESPASNQGLIALASSLTAAARGKVSEAVAEACRPVRRDLRQAAEADPLRGAFAVVDVLLPGISDLLTQAYFAHVLVRSA